ncbi:hypothetical protein J6590_016083 [Homalodisca vitripennis]|nr:hypothetical protein J6590_016083 [Homalodisca vitripennis]
MGFHIFELLFATQNGFSDKIPEILSGSKSSFDSLKPFNVHRVNWEFATNVSADAAVVRPKKVDRESSRVNGTVLNVLITQLAVATSDFVQQGVTVEGRRTKDCFSIHLSVVKEDRAGS